MGLVSTTQPDQCGFETTCQPGKREKDLETEEGRKRKRDEETGRRDKGQEEGGEPNSSSLSLVPFTTSSSLFLIPFTASSSLVLFLPPRSTYALFGYCLMIPSANASA